MATATIKISHKRLLMDNPRKVFMNGYSCLFLLFSSLDDIRAGALMRKSRVHPGCLSSESGTCLIGSRPEFAKLNVY